MHARPFPAAKWVRDDHGNWRVKPRDAAEPVPWIPLDPLEPDHDLFPRFEKAKAVTVTLRPGDLLYLPALWLHHVQQTGEPAIAVNWWYDMNYDSPVWHLHRLVRRLTLALDDQEEEAEDCD